MPMGRGRSDPFNSLENNYGFAMNTLFAFEISSLHLPLTVALAAVATVGYLVGLRRRHEQAIDEEETQAREELHKATSVAAELESIVESVRNALAMHHGSVARFKERMNELRNEDKDVAWEKLCDEADEMLKPTLQLAGEISQAYESIRQQTNHLATFTDARTDSLTGVGNRRALDEALTSMFAMLHRYELPFSLMIFDIDNFGKFNDEQGRLHGDQTLQQVASLLAAAARDTDVVVRYGGGEFVVVMPHTDLAGVSIFAQRFREQIEQDLKVTVSGGVVEALDADTSESIVARADTALYSAKAAGRNQVYRHDGVDTEVADAATGDLQTAGAEAYVVG
jgi:diguanylate cyclase